MRERGRERERDGERGRKREGEGERDQFFVCACDGDEVPGDEVVGEQRRPLALAVHVDVVGRHPHVAQRLQTR